MDYLEIKERRLSAIHLLLSFVLLLLVNAFGLRECYGMLLIYMFWSAFVYGQMLFWEIKGYKGLSILPFYLVGCIFRVVVGGVQMAVDALNGERIWYFVGRDEITDYIFPTVLWMNIAYMIFLLVVLKKFRMRLSAGTVLLLLNRYNLRSIAIICFVLSIVYKLFLGDLVFPSFVSSIVVNMDKFALLIYALNCAYNRGASKMQFNVFITLIVVDCWVAMFYGFFKSGIIMPIFFFYIYYFLKCKERGVPIYSLKSVVLLCLLFIFVSSFVYPFMNIKRVESGFSAQLGTNTKSYSNLDILQRVLNGDVPKESSDSNQGFNRMNAIPPNAYFYKDVNVHDKYIHQIFLRSIEIMIPRFLYPNKPNNDVGLLATAYVNTGNTANAKYESSFTYIGFFASSYIIGGGVMVILFCCINGLLLSMYVRFIFINISNPIALLYLYFLLFQALTAFEETHNGLLPGIVGFVSSYVLILITNRLTKKFHI